MLNKPFIYAESKGTGHFIKASLSLFFLSLPSIVPYLAMFLINSYNVYYIEKVNTYETPEEEDMTL